MEVSASVRWRAVPVLLTPAAVVAAVFLLVTRDGSGAFADCSSLPGRGVPILRDHHHIPAVDAPHEHYDSSPPTSGPHVPWVVQPGVYDTSIPAEVQVHVLEHGHVLVQYAPTTRSSLVMSLRRLALEFRHDVVLAPSPLISRGVVMTAWGRIERLPASNHMKAREFILRLRGRYGHGWQGDARPCTGTRS